MTGCTLMKASMCSSFTESAGWWGHSLPGYLLKNGESSETGERQKQLSLLDSYTVTLLSHVRRLIGVAGCPPSMVLLALPVGSTASGSRLAVSLQKSRPYLATRSLPRLSCL